MRENEFGSGLTFSLEQNYPNPFNSSTNIRYQIYQSGWAKLKIYDILGREIKLLVNENKSPGDYQINFNNSELPSGIYFYSLEIRGYSKVNKMILLK